MATRGDAPYLPFLDGPRLTDPADFRWRLGLRPLDLHDWIELGPDADAIVAGKAALNEAHADTVFSVLDGTEAECAEAATALFEHLRERWPTRYRDVFLDPDLHPLDAVARLIPEDLVLLVERDGRLVFAGGSVCSPSRWDLRSKLGLTMAGVHAPVARLNEQLEEPITRFFDRLTPQRSYWRLGWTIVDMPDLYTPVDGTAGPRPVDPAPGDHYLRVERETLRRLPVTNAVLFTIRTFVTPITFLTSDPSVAERVAGALEALPDDVQEYKDLASTASSLIDHLRAAVDPSIS